MDKEQQDKLRKIAAQMNAAMGYEDIYERLVRLITFGSLPDVGKALENFASIVGQDSMSLEERKQACMDVVLREGKRAYNYGVEIGSAGRKGG